MPEVGGAEVLTEWELPGDPGREVATVAETPERGTVRRVSASPRAETYEAELEVERFVDSRMVR